MHQRFFHIFFCFLLLSTTSVFAQDITGLWKGELYVDSTKQYLPYEITISEKKGKLSGYAYLSFQQNGREQVVVRKIAVKQKDDQVSFEDDDLVDDNGSFNIPRNIRQTTNVTLRVKDSMMYLTGEWSTNRSRRVLSSFGTIKLERKNYFKTTALYKKLDSLKLSDKLAFTEGPPVITTAVAVLEKKLTPTVIAKVEAPVAETKPVPETIVTPPPVKPKPAEPVIAVVEKKPEPVKMDTPVAVPKPVVEIAIKKQPENTIAAVVKKPTPPPVVVTPPTVKPAAPATKPPATAVAVKTTVAAAVTKPTVKPPVTKPVVVAKAAAKPVPAVPKPVVAVPVKVVAPVVAVAKPVQTVLIDPSTVNAATDVNARSIATTQSVFYKSDSLVLTLYDNGEVDGDVVSVLMNGKLIFANQALTTKANSKTIYITPDTPDSLMLVMYAENLGSIPPNTGLLVIHDGEDTYDLRFKADLKTNAAIILRRKPKQ